MRGLALEQAWQSWGGPWTLAALLMLPACSERNAPAAAESRPGMPASAAASSHPTPSAAPEPLTRGFSMGERYRYSMKLSTSVRFEEDRAAFDFDLFGDVELRAVRVKPEAAMLYATITNVRVVNRVPETQSDLDKMRAELRQHGAFFTIAGGRAGELLVPSGLTAMAASTYRQIAASVQFVHAEPKAERYTADEYDTTGQYVAEYSRGADGRAWSKRKQRYTALLGAAPGTNGASKIVPEIVQSSGEVRLAASGQPVSVKLMDELVIKHPQLPVRSKLAIELEAIAVTAPVADPDFIALLSKTRRYAATDPIVEAPSEAELDDARIGNLDFATILRQLEELGRAQKPVEVGPDRAPPALTPQQEEEKRSVVGEQARLFGALSATFRKTPPTIERAVAKIRAASPAADALVDALGSASTPAAHSALGKLLDSMPLGSEQRGRIIVTLARVQRPTPEATLALRAVLEKEPFQAGALYGIGSHARLLRDQGRIEEVKVLGELLVQRLARADDALELGTVLRAIANSGYDAALPSVLPFLDDKRTEIRSAATWAMQSMLDARVDPLIAKRLAADESSEVQSAAIDAARLRQPSDPLAAALSAAGTGAADAHVRYQAVELMLLWLPARPDLRGAVDKIARLDAEPRVRRLALAGL
jgi:hypothetical protein